jgi:hypothetical protein
MPEPDFDALRTEVEAATRLPEFDSVARRARRLRRRFLSRRIVTTLTSLAILLPAAVAAVNAAPHNSGVQGQDAQIGLEPPDAPIPTPTPSTAPVATIRAIAGTRIGSLYAAVDVCRPGEVTNRCSLQVVPLGATAQDQRGPIATDELRAEPTDSLDEVRLLALTSTSLLLSGIRPDGERKSRRINISGGGAEIAPEPIGATGPSVGDFVVQLRQYGELSFVRQIDSRVIRLQKQPPIREYTLVTSIPPDRGWWVTGTDPATGELAVAVSKDLGVTWEFRTLGLRPGVADPVLATGDGRTVFVFVRTSTGLQQRRSTDGGLSWATLTTPMPWPSFRTSEVSRPFGAVVRLDGSLLVWVEEPPGAVFLDSVDSGASYRAASGPSGPIVGVLDGFVAVADPPSVSIDGHTWSTLPRPPVELPS